MSLEICLLKSIFTQVHHFLVFQQLYLKLVSYYLTTQKLAFLTEWFFLILRLLSIFKLKIYLVGVSGQKIIFFMHFFRWKPGKQIHAQRQQCEH